MATLKTTLTETLTLNGKNYGNTISDEIVGINNVYQTIITITSATTVFVLQFTAGNAQLGTIKDGELKYLRITNLDSTNYVDIALDNGGDYYQRIKAGESFVLTDDQVNTGAGFATLDLIKAQANTADVNVEIFIATA